MQKWIIVDVASAPLANVADYIDAAAIDAPANYSKPEAIAAYVAKAYAQKVEAAGLDLDLARLTAIGLHDASGQTILTARTEDEEREVLRSVAAASEGCSIVTYNGLSFDLPLLMRRARYLSVPFPAWNLDKFRTNHLDVLNLLSGGDPSRRRPLGFYAKRLGWTDVQKPLSGAAESKVHETGDWDGLAASVAHDVEVTRRLGLWLGLL